MARRMRPVPPRTSWSWWPCAVVGQRGLRGVELHAAEQDCDPAAACRRHRPTRTGEHDGSRRGLWKGLADAGQDIQPIICLAAVAPSAWRRKVRQTLFTDVAQGQASDAMDGMSWRQFEMLGEGIGLQGHQVVETDGGGVDGGIDLVLAKHAKNGSETFLVQCNEWRVPARASSSERLRIV